MIPSGIGKKDTEFRRVIAVEKLLAVELRHFSTENAYRTVSKVFGIAKSTVIKILREVTCELVPVSSDSPIY